MTMEIIRQERPLDARKPLCTKTAKVSLVQKLGDGRWICQNDKSGTILVVDKYGRDVKKKTPVIFNGLPEDFAPPPRQHYDAGQEVIVMRMLSSKRKLFTGKVIADTGVSVIVNVDNVEGMRVFASKKLDTGGIAFPRHAIFATLDDVEAFLAKFTGEIAEMKAAARAKN